MSNDKQKIEKVNLICKQVLKLTDADFKAVSDMADEQCSYMHPLKLATQDRINTLGEKNKNIINALIALKKAIQELKVKS